MKPQASAAHSPDVPLEQLEIRARELRFPALACGSGPLVLCLHGFPDTHHTFRHLLPALARAGYRAVAPALRGYAPTCLPRRGDCHALEVARDAAAIVGALGEQHAHLIGHDWGAVASYLAAALSPGTWRSITTLAIPHPLGLVENLPRLPQQVRRSWYMLFFQLPQIAEHVVAARDFAFLEQLWRTWSPSYRATAADLGLLKAAFREPGVIAASLAYYRNMFAVLGAPARDALSLLHMPIAPPLLALSGAEDGCIDRRMFALAMDGHPRRAESFDRFSSVVVEELWGVGHFMHLEDPARLGARIIAWLQAQP